MKIIALIPALVLGAASIALSTSALANDPVTGVLNATGDVLNGVGNAAGSVAGGVANGTADVARGTNRALTGGHRYRGHHHHHHHYHHHHHGMHQNR